MAEARCAAAPKSRVKNFFLIELKKKKKTNQPRTVPHVFSIFTTCSPYTLSDKQNNTVIQNMEQKRKRKHHRRSFASDAQMQKCVGVGGRRCEWKYCKHARLPSTLWASICGIVRLRVKQATHGKKKTKKKTRPEPSDHFSTSVLQSPLPFRTCAV